MRRTKLNLVALGAVSGGAIDFNYDPNARPTIDLTQRRRDLDADYWSFSDAVRNGREAVTNIEENNERLDPNASPELRQEFEDANRGWQDQLDTARDRIEESNQFQEQNGREPWSEDMVPPADEAPDYYNYDNSGTEEAPIYEA